MTSDGSPYARLRRALTTGNLLLVRAAARELPQVPLDDALRIALLMARAQDPRDEPAAIRWLARLCLERPRAVSTTSPTCSPPSRRSPPNPATPGRR